MHTYCAKALALRCANTRTTAHRLLKPVFTLEGEPLPRFFTELPRGETCHKGAFVILEKLIVVSKLPDEGATDATAERVLVARQQKAIRTAIQQTLAVIFTTQR